MVFDGAKWQEGVLGCRLQWAPGNNAEGPYTFPIDLYDSPNGTDRVDWTQRGQEIDHVVEAPIWSWWDHNNDGFHELYWSIGPSDPKKPDGSCTPYVKAVRRGDINWNGNTPWIYVWGPAGEDGDMMSNNMDCYHLTHPEFHQKAKAAAYVECWTVANVDDIDVAMAQCESPSTNRFYCISDIVAEQGPVQIQSTLCAPPRWLAGYG